MQEQRRIRKAVKWGGPVVAVTIMIAWCVSEVWSVQWWTAHSICNLGCGTLDVSYMSEEIPTLSQTLSVGPAREKWYLRKWLPGVKVYDTASGGTSVGVDVPLWLPLVLSVAASVAAWRLDARAALRRRAGNCSACGYVRAGLGETAACPECGAAATTTKTTPADT